MKPVKTMEHYKRNNAEMEAIMDCNIYGWLEEDSQHSIVRAKERAGLNEKRARKMMELARQRGIRSEECRWNVDREFLESKCNEDVEAVAYNGYCFILERMTLHCITVFALPKDFGKKKTYYRTTGRRVGIRFDDAYCY